ncbi:2-amino-4-hydroxy-6-hydroxymethyldihydropteridine diphosphokinase, partial [candidate division KSB1 bacterium]
KKYIFILNMKKEIAYLSLGSNMGDRMAHLAAAEEKLASHSQIEILKKSKVYETEPWPLHTVEDEKEHPHSEDGQMWFLNQAIQIKTDLSPQELLEIIESIESDIGRTEKHHWGHREIDIDILLYGTQVVESSELIIPHRHLNDRQFVLMPLIEIEPDLKDPVNGKTYKAILKNIKDEHKVEPYF